MTVTYSTPKIKPGSVKRRDTQDGKTERSIVLEVVASGGYGDPDGVLAAIAIERGDTYSHLGTTDGTVVCVGREPSDIAALADGGSKWEVSYSYTSHPGGKPPSNSGGSTPSADPEDQPPDYSWDYETLQRPMNMAFYVEATSTPNYTAEGNPEATERALTNSAKQLVTQVPTYNEMLEVLRITSNWWNYPRTESKTYGFAVNKDTWQGDDPGTWLCKPYKGQYIYSPNGNYWRVIREFIHSPFGWDFWTLDQGTREHKNTGSGYEFVTPKGRDGLPLGLIPLDGAGEMLSEAARNANQFINLRWRKKAWINFAGLSITVPS